MPSKPKANTPGIGASTMNGRNSRAARRTSSPAVMTLIRVGPNSANSTATTSAKPRPHSSNQPGRIRKAPGVARAKGAAAELLRRVGKAIEEEGADQQEIVEHGVRRQRDVAGAGALGGEEQEHGDQRRGADHDVGVHRQQPHQFATIEQASARVPQSRHPHSAGRRSRRARSRSSPTAARRSPRPRCRCRRPAPARSSPPC